VYAKKIEPSQDSGSLPARHKTMLVRTDDPVSKKS